MLFLRQILFLNQNFLLSPTNASVHHLSLASIIAANTPLLLASSQGAMTSTSLSSSIKWFCLVDLIVNEYLYKRKFVCTCYPWSLKKAFDMVKLAISKTQNICLPSYKDVYG